MRHICGVVEAISLQATLVFGLLRYARNDKNQDATRLKASRHDNPEIVIANPNRVKHSHCQQIAALRSR